MVVSFGFQGTNQVSGIQQVFLGGGSGFSPESVFGTVSNSEFGFQVQVYGDSTWLKSLLPSLLKTVDALHYVIFTDVAWHTTTAVGKRGLHSNSSTGVVEAILENIW
jgi:hypothetical protein